MVWIGKAPIDSCVCMFWHREWHYKEMWPCWTTFVTVCVSLWRQRCGIIYAQATPSMTAHFLLPADQDVELSFCSPVSCLPACHQAAHYKDNGPKLWNCKPIPIKYFFVWVAMVRVFLHSNRNSETEVSIRSKILLW